MIATDTKAQTIKKSTTYRRIWFRRRLLWCIFCEQQPFQLQSQAKTSLIQPSIPSLLIHRTADGEKQASTNQPTDRSKLWQKNLFYMCQCESSVLMYLHAPPNLLEGSRWPSQRKKWKPLLSLEKIPRMWRFLTCGTILCSHVFAIGAHRYSFHTGCRSSTPRTS